MSSGIRIFYRAAMAIFLLGVWGEARSARAAQLVDDFEYGLPAQVISSPLTNHGWTLLAGGGRNVVSVPGTDTPNPTRFALAQSGSGRIARNASLNGQTEPGFVAEFDMLVGGVVEGGNATLSLAAGSPSAPQVGITFGVLNPAPFTNEASAFYIQTPTRISAVPAIPLGGWVRFRLLINPKAYDGDGAGWLQIGTGLTGGNWQPIKGLEGVRLGFKDSGAQPPGSWGTIVLDLPRFVGADNIAVGDEVIARLRALEVTQGTQDPFNRVPLVEGKKTFVRALLEAPEGESGGYVMFGRLRGFRNGVELPGSPLPRFLVNAPGEREPFPVPAAGKAFSTREAFGDTINFLLPQSWTTNQLELRLDSDVVIECDAPLPNGGCGALVQFQHVPPLHVQFWPVRVEGTNPPVTATTSDLWSLHDSLEAMYPVAAFDFSVGKTLSINLDLTNERTLTPLLEHLDSLWVKERDSGRIASNEIFYAVIPRVASGTTVGRAYIGRNAGVGLVNHFQNDYTYHIFEHELGHTLGRPHAVDHTIQTNGQSRGYCNEVAYPSDEAFPFFFRVAGSMRPTLGDMSSGDSNLVYGLSALGVQRLQSGASVEPVLTPTNHFELMGYCQNFSRKEPWASSHTYVRLMTAIQRRFGPAPAAARPLFAGGPQDYLLVRGTINRVDGTTVLRPAIRSSLAAPPLSAPGPFTCRVLDSFGATLSETAFHTQQDSDADVDESFVVQVPCPPAARQVVILSEGVELATFTASPQAPVVQLVAPNGGQQLSADPVVVSWAATDPDGDALFFQLQYSADGGATWSTVAADLRGTSHAIPNQDLPASGNAYFRIVASDGFHTASDTTDAGSVVMNHPPQAFISGPGSNATFYADGLIMLDGAGLDPDEGSITENNLTWMSDQSGFLGAGRHLELFASQLAPGEHVITLTARDQQGLVASSSNRITVVAFAPPWLRAELNETNQMLQLEVHGTPQTRLVVEASSNLLHWLPWRTITQTNRSQRLTELLPSSNPMRYFRARTEVLPTAVIQQPASVAGLTGNQLALSIEVLGSRPAFQWFFNGSALTHATNATLSFSNALPAQSGSYFVVVSNFSGVVTSSTAFVTILGAVMEEIHAFGTNSLDGINGWGPLTFGSDGWLYGCARNGAMAGAGVAFKLRPDGSEYTVLRRFQAATDGATPLGGVIEGSDGKLYGTTSVGGTNNAGTIFSMNKDGSDFTVLRHFQSTGDCRNPQAELLEASDGALYGTAYSGGGFGRGGVFRIQKDGSGYAIISGLNFGGSEAPSQPLGGLMEALDGFLYGSSEFGGLSNKGTIFRLARNGSGSVVLKSLGLVAGGAANPNGTLLQANDGFLYGATYSGGPSNLGGIIKLSTDGAFFSVIAGFGTNVAAGLEPRAGLTAAPNGQLLGTTRIGGAANQGVIYRINRNGSGYETLRSFSSGGNPGARSRSPLLHAPGHVFYGMTFGGGVNDQGVIFRFFLPELVP